MSPASAASKAVAARARGPSSATRSARDSGPRLLLSTTSWPAATASRATVLPMLPLPMSPMVVMSGASSRSAVSFPAVISAAELADDVGEQRPEHRQGVRHASRRAGQVDDQGAAGDPREAAREHRRRHALLGAVAAHRLGDARRLPLDHRAGGLGRDVGGGEPGATGGEDDVEAHVDRRAEHRLELGDVVRTHVRALDGEPELPEPRREGLAAAVLVDPRGGPVGGGDDDGAGAGRQIRGHRVHSPLLPPDFASSRTSVIDARGSTAFTMSIIVSPATATEVSASISTPVRSAVRAVAVISTASSVTSRSTVTPCSAIGWHSGTRSGVRLAPAIPAIRATATASPFGIPSPRSSATTSGLTSTRPAAVATRVVTAFSETSTIRAAPCSSTWVRRGWEVTAALLRSGRRPPRRPRAAR